MMKSLSKGGVGALGLLLTIAGLAAASIQRPVASGPLPAAAMSGRPGLTVMTYNIEGLPWPVRFGRAAAFDAIGDRLRAMREEGVQPHIVAFQEAFADDARAIGMRAGYRYAVDGPNVAMPGAPPIGQNDEDFEQARSFWKGETAGKLVGSGLQILSDYPVLAVHRQPFPAAACAGYDCLANKGMVMAVIAVPGQATPVAVVDLHMNSRIAAGVEPARSLIAYRAQVDALADFLKAYAPPGVPVIVAGDFNLGQEAARAAYVEARLSPWLGGKPRNAFGDCLGDAECRDEMPVDAYRSLYHGRDWQFIRQGSSARLIAQSISTPFGHEPSGGMLSDHIGYAVSYRMIPKA